VERTETTNVKRVSNSTEQKCLQLHQLAPHKLVLWNLDFTIFTGFLPICQNQIQGLFNDFQGPYEGYI